MAMPDVAQFPCPECGADTTYEPGTWQLRCAHCDARTEIARPSTEIPVHAYAAGVAARPAMGPTLATAHVLACKTCGAHTESAKHATRCPFCDSAMIAELPLTPAHAPQGILPFAVAQPAAQQAFAAWLGSRWFAPRKLATRAARDGLDGVYVPYWSFDAQTHTTYTGQRGENYTETERYTENGESKTRTVTKTRWHAVAGTVHVPFQHVLVPGTSLPEPVVTRLEPWDLEALVTFEPRLVAGFASERQPQHVDEGYAKACARMVAPIEAAIRRDIGGDHQRVDKVQTAYRDVGWRHVLLPLWISAFRYNDRVFRVIVNARTGEVSGERPYSALKIALLVLAIVGGLIGLLMAVRG